MLFQDSKKKKKNQKTTLCGISVLVSTAPSSFDHSSTAATVQNPSIHFLDQLNSDLGTAQNHIENPDIIPNLFWMIAYFLYLLLLLLLWFCNVNYVTIGVFAQFWNNLHSWPRVCQWLVSPLSISLPWAGSLHTADACSSNQCVREWDWASAAGGSSNMHRHASPTACGCSQLNGWMYFIVTIGSSMRHCSHHFHKLLCENNRSTVY